MSLQGRGLDPERPQSCQFSGFTADWPLAMRSAPHHRRSQRAKDCTGCPFWAVLWLRLHESMTFEVDPFSSLSLERLEQDWHILEVLCPGLSQADSSTLGPLQLSIQHCSVCLVYLVIYTLFFFYCVMVWLSCFNMVFAFKVTVLGCT